MIATTGSPNWHWQQLGYRVDRQQLPSGNNIRTIWRPDGTQVKIERREGERGQEAETRAALAERFPHGESECAQAQLDIFSAE